VDRQMRILVECMESTRSCEMLIADSGLIDLYFTVQSFQRKSCCRSVFLRLVLTHMTTFTQIVSLSPNIQAPDLILCCAGHSNGQRYEKLHVSNYLCSAKGRSDTSLSLLSFYVYGFIELFSLPTKAAAKHRPF
jgi:hypothetical protein